MNALRAIAAESESFDGKGLLATGGGTAVPDVENCLVTAGSVEGKATEKGLVPAFYLLDARLADSSQDPC